MPRPNPEFIDTAQYFGAVDYPLRCKSRGVTRLLEGLAKNVMFPLAAASPLLLLAIPLATLLPDGYQGAMIALIMLCGAVLAGYTLRSYRTEQGYDKVHGQFLIRRWLWNRPLRTYIWDTQLFSGISSAVTGRGDRRVSRVRLHTRKEGFLVDNFMPTDSAEIARLTARWLTHYSGLPLLPDSSSVLHNPLDDLRNNGWLVQRMQPAAPAEPPSSAGVYVPPGPAGLPSLVSERADTPERVTGRLVVYVFALASLAVAAFFLRNELQLRSDLAVIARGEVAGEQFVVTAVMDQVRTERHLDSWGKLRTRYIPRRMVNLKSDEGRTLLYPWTEGLSTGTRVVGYTVDGRLRLPDYSHGSANLAAMTFALIFPGLVAYRVMRRRHRSS